MTSAPRKRITVLGATGSIGANTLDVVARHPDRFEVFALTAGRQIDRLARQCVAFRPRFAALPDGADAARLRQMLRDARCDTEVLSDRDALESVSNHPDVDTVVAAIVGAAGLRATLAAVRAAKNVLLANKESLVMAGALFMAEVRRSGAVLLPIDSEHNAVFQSLPKGFPRDLDAVGVRRVLLTASGGPFRRTALDRLATVTPAQACDHPNWVMGPKISVDSATMMNKGLEVIEAHWLFNARSDAIDVVIHPQSVVHSLVEYVDGSMIAQLGTPDMRIPIAYSLAYPERIDAGAPALDLVRVTQLTFEQPEGRRFPCLGLAYSALSLGGTAPAVLNAANEVAVEAFLAGRLRFDRIAVLIGDVLDRAERREAAALDDLFDADAAARRLAGELVAKANRTGA